MFRKLACAAVVLFAVVGVLSAETIKGKITKCDGKTVSIIPAKEKEAKTLEIAKDCKVCEMVKKDKKEVEGGLKSERLTTIGDKGVAGAVVTNADGKVTEIILAGKKK